MPSPYTPPDVIVTQERISAQSTTQAPPLPVCILAPCVAIVTRESAGDYAVGTAFQAPLPDLPVGATVDPTSLQVLLQAAAADGSDLGLFQLTLPTDAQLGADNVSVTVNANLALAYSLLSARNNQGPGTSQFDDLGSGIPDGIRFTDDSFDFLSLGASINDTDIVVSTPASQAGTYRIYELVGSGVQVNQVKVQKIADVTTGVPVLQKTFNITGGGFSAVNGTAIINGSSTDVANADVGLISPGGTVATIGTADYPSSGGFHLPAATSADQIVVALPGGQPGNTITAFAALVAASNVGDFLRVAGDSVSAANSDFKIVAVNLSTPSITVQRLGQSSTGQITAGGGGSATMALLRVLRGSTDVSNGAGDFVSMTIAGANVDFEVSSASPKQLVLTATVTGLTGATAVTARRGLPFRNSVVSFDLVKRLTTGFTGTVLTSFTAARSDLSLDGPIIIGSEADIAANLGIVHPSNPAALMADMVIRSGLTSGGGSFYVMVTDDNTLESYQAGLDTLLSYEVYYLVPATQDTDILAAVKAHIDAQSQPSQKHERIGIFSGALTTSVQRIPATIGASWPTDGAVSSGSPAVFGSTSIDWTLVKPGDVIKVLASAAANAAVLESHRIKSVNVSAHNATTLDSFTSAVFGTPQIFRIESYPYSKDQQAADWRDYAASQDDFRIFILRPDVVAITYTDTTTANHTDKQIIVPSYYAAAALAGLASSLPPQQPMTNVPLPGIDKLFHSNAYFTPDQLNTIAEGGNLILVQANANSAPYAREAISTDMTSIITKTMSITKDVDFAAKYVRESFRPYIGNKNITSELLTQLRGIGEAIVRGLILSESMLPGTQLVSLSQNVDQPDAVDVVIALKVPYPCNKIYVTLQV